MKGMKGERKAYGITSLLDGMLAEAGFNYQGTRMGRDTKKPWIMYETDRGEPADLQELDAALIKQGYVHYQSEMDDEPDQYPMTGSYGGRGGVGNRYEQYRYMKRGRDGIVSEVLYVTTRFYEAGKGKKDYTNFEQIYY